VRPIIKKDCSKKVAVRKLKVAAIHTIRNKILSRAFAAVKRETP
jgi:hypothetical protein